MSFGPISIRRGTPRSSHSANFQPGVCESRSSRKHADAARPQRRLDLLRFRQDGLLPVAARDRHDDHLVRGDPWRQEFSPLSSPCVMITPPMSRVETPQDVVHACWTALSRPWNWIPNALAKFCPRFVGGPGLQRAAVAHQRLDRIGPRGAGELLALALLAVDDRHRQLGLGALLVEGEDLERLLLRFLGGLVRGMPFLPEELRRPQETAARDFLPSARRSPTG